MRIHHLQHVPFEGLGAIDDWAQQQEHPVTVTRLHAGDPLPDAGAFDWLIVMGGPMSATDEGTIDWLTREKRFIESAIHDRKPVLGVCLGAQLIASVLGARVYANAHKEIGWFDVRLTPDARVSPAFSGLPDVVPVFQWHGETFDLPQGAQLVATGDVCTNQAFVYDERVIGLQFHLETTRQSAQALVANCGNELTDAPYVQSADCILGDDGRFAQIRGNLDRLLRNVAETAGVLAGG